MGVQLHANEYGCGNGCEIEECRVYTCIIHEPMLSLFKVSLLQTDVSVLNFCRWMK